MAERTTGGPIRWVRDVSSRLHPSSVRYWFFYISVVDTRNIHHTDVGIEGTTEEEEGKEPMRRHLQTVKHYGTETSVISGNCEQKRNQWKTF